MAYAANEKRYEAMVYNKCGESGLKLPAVSLGLWHNFGDTGNFENMKQMMEMAEMLKSIMPDNTSDQIADADFSDLFQPYRD